MEENMGFRCWCGLAVDHPPVPYTDEIAKDHSGPLYTPPDDER